MPHTTRAAVLTEHGAPFELQRLPLPHDLAAGAAVVQITCATLCGTDVEVWTGKMTHPGMLPMVPGHEMVGIVRQVGPGTVDALGRPVQVGDRLGWSEATCGHCYACEVLRSPVQCENRGYGFLQNSDRPPHVIGGLAEQVYVSPECAKLLLPDDVKDTWAAMSGCAAKTVLHAVDRTGGIRAGSRVVVQGAGALGIFATAVARLAGAAQVITIGAPTERLELARRFGADAVVDIREGDVVARVTELTDGRGADYVFDFAGAASVGPEAVEMAALHGAVTIVGSTGPVGDPVALSTIMRKELTVRGSLNGDIADYVRAIDFFRAFRDRFDWDELFSPPVGLSELTDAYRSMEEQTAVKAVIDPRLDSESAA